MKKISVVIPVYNEEKHIRECLKALTENTVKPYEILVVDGRSEDRTVEIAKRFPEVKVYTNEKRTAAGGRNVGILKAKGEIIAFTDGDCIVDRNWIQSISDAFETYEIDGLGGKVDVAVPENRYEEYWNNLAWTQLMNFGDERYLVEERTLNDSFVTANCAYTRKLLWKLKGFSNWFANNAEDVDLSWRALDLGARLMYCPDVKIKAHGVDSLKGIKQKSFRNGVSSSKLQKRYGKRINYDWNIYKMLFHNMRGVLKREDIAQLNVMELSFHLLGKYYGSLKYRVFNI